MKKLKRSRINRVILGVCGGLGNYFNVNAWLFRLLFILLSGPSLGGVAIVYLILGMVIPEDKTKNPLDSISDMLKGHSSSQQRGASGPIQEAEKVYKD